MKKKIIFFLESLQGGGAEKVLSDIVRNINPNKYDVYVKTIADNGVYVNEIKKYAKYSSYLKSADLSANIFKRFLYKIRYKLIYMVPAHMASKILFRNESYDIGIAFIEGYATKILGVNSNSFKKKITWIHVDPIERDYADQYFKNIDEEISCYKRYDKILCVSESVKKSVCAKYNLSNNVMVQYNPVDRKKVIDFSSIDHVKKNDGFTLISAGRLEEQKGFDRLIKCFYEIYKETNLNLYLQILGEGSRRAELESLIKEYGIEQKVELLGFKTNPYPYIKNADLFVCSSIAEGYSLVVAEALILGKPVVSTNCSGPNELLANGEYGILVDNTEQCLKEGILNLLINEKEYQKYKELAIIRSEWFKIESIIKEIEEIFDDE